MMVQRDDLTVEAIEQIMDLLRRALAERALKHGRGAWAGPHEVLGVMVEEQWELMEAVQQDSDAVRQELLDIAVVAVWGLASLGGGTEAHGEPG